MALHLEGPIIGGLFAHEIWWAFESINFYQVLITAEPLDIKAAKPP